MKSFLKKYIHKFQYAFQGLFHGILFDQSIRLQAWIALIVIVFCLFLSLTWVQWTIIISMILMVLAAEFVNSTIEEICDVLFPSYDRRVKKIKDYAAAAVLLLSMLAAVVGLYVIGGTLL